MDHTPRFCQASLVPCARMTWVGAYWFNHPWMRARPWSVRMPPTLTLTSRLQARPVRVLISVASFWVQTLPGDTKL